MNTKKSGTETVAEDNGIGSEEIQVQRIKKNIELVLSGVSAEISRKVRLQLGRDGLAGAAVAELRSFRNYTTELLRQKFKGPVTREQVKVIDGKAYVYIEWKEGGHRRSQYLRPATESEHTSLKKRREKSG